MPSAHATTGLGTHRASSARLPAALWARVGVVAGMLSCVIGGVLGLLLGLSHPATVWFAIPEGAFILGVPGAILGLVVGVAATGVRALWRARAR